MRGREYEESIRLDYLKRLNELDLLYIDFFYFFKMFCIRKDCLMMVKRRAHNAGLPETTCNHTFRGTGITVFLENGGKLEDAQRMANHASAKTTKLYDRRSDDVTVEMVELVRI